MDYEIIEQDKPASPTQLRTILQKKRSLIANGEIPDASSSQTFGEFLLEHSPVNQQNSGESNPFPRPITPYFPLNSPTGESK